MYPRLISIGLLGAIARAAAAPLPEDPRLGATRVELQALVDDAGRAALPADLLVDKVREGLAKNVPAPRIAQATRALATALAESRDQASTRLSAPPASLPPRLLRALAEARTGGASPSEIDRVLGALASKHASPPASARAAEALADLVARGFPPAAAGRAVATLIERSGPDALALDRLGADAARLWKTNGGQPEAALDEATRADPSRRSATDHGASDTAHSTVDDHGPNRETSGQRNPPHPGKKN